MAVGLGLPSLVKVVSSRYFLAWPSANVAATSGGPQFQADVALGPAAQLREEVEHLSEQPVAIADRGVDGLDVGVPRMVATASTGSPLTLPVRSHSAMVTRGVLRMRLTFHESLPVITRARSPSAAIQIAVGLGLPSLVNVVSETYWDLITSAKLGAITTNLAELPCLEVALGLQQHPAQPVQGGGVGFRPHAASYRLEQSLGHPVQRPWVGLVEELCGSPDPGRTSR